MSDSKVIDSIRAKLSSMQNQNTRRMLTWKPTKGEEAQVRILPYKHGPDPFNELYFHYNLGNTKLALCPSMSLGGVQKCPICEYVDQLRRIQPRTAQVEKTILELAVRMRVYVPVIIRGREAEGVKFWGIGKQTYSSIAQLFVDPEYGDISDVLKGRDLKVLASPPSGKDRYGRVNIRPSANASRLNDNLDQMKEWVNGCPKVFDAFPTKNYAELQEILREFVSVAEEASTTQENSSVESSPVAPVDLPPKTEDQSTPLDAGDDVETIDALLGNLAQNPQ